MRRLISPTRKNSTSGDFRGVGLQVRLQRSEIDIDELVLSACLPSLSGPVAGEEAERQCGLVTPELLVEPAERAAAMVRSPGRGCPQQEFAHRSARVIFRVSCAAAARMRPPVVDEEDREGAMQETAARGRSFSRPMPAARLPGSTRISGSSATVRRY